MSKTLTNVELCEKLHHFERPSVVVRLHASNDSARGNVDFRRRARFKRRLPRRRMVQTRARTLSLGRSKPLQSNRIPIVGAKSIDRVGLYMERGLFFCGGMVVAAIVSLFMLKIDTRANSSSPGRSMPSPSKLSPSWLLQNMESQLTILRQNNTLVSTETKRIEDERTDLAQLVSLLTILRQSTSHTPTAKEEKRDFRPKKVHIVASNNDEFKEPVQVKLPNENSWRSTKAGDLFPEGTLISTGPGGHITLYFDFFDGGARHGEGGMLTVEENSVLRLTGDSDEPKIIKGSYTPYGGAGDTGGAVYAGKH